MKQFECGTLVPGCDAKFTGETEEDILAQVPGHAAEAHGIEEVTPELAEQVRAAIHEGEEG